MQKMSNSVKLNWLTKVDAIIAQYLNDTFRIQRGADSNSLAEFIKQTNSFDAAFQHIKKFLYDKISLQQTSSTLFKKLLAPFCSFIMQIPVPEDAEIKLIKGTWQNSIKINSNILFFNASNKVTNRILHYLPTYEKVKVRCLSQKDKSFFERKYHVALISFIENEFSSILEGKVASEQRETMKKYSKGSFSSSLDEVDDCHDVTFYVGGVIEDNKSIKYTIYPKDQDVLMCGSKMQALEIISKAVVASIKNDLKSTEKEVDDLFAKNVHDNNIFEVTVKFSDRGSNNKKNITEINLGYIVHDNKSMKLKNLAIDFDSVNTFFQERLGPGVDNAAPAATPLKKFGR